MLRSEEWTHFFDHIDDPVIFQSTNSSQRKLLCQFGEAYRQISLGMVPVCPRQFYRALLTASRLDICDIFSHRVTEASMGGVGCGFDWLILTHPVCMICLFVCNHH